MGDRMGRSFVPRYHNAPDAFRVRRSRPRNAPLRPSAGHSRVTQCARFGSAITANVFACSEGESHMSATMQSEQPDAIAASGEFEGDIREFVRKDVAPWRKRPDPAE